MPISNEPYVMTLNKSERKVATIAATAITMVIFAAGIKLDDLTAKPKPPVIIFDEITMRRVGELRNRCVLFQASLPAQDEPEARVLAIWCPTQRLPFEAEDIRP